MKKSKPPVVIWVSTWFAALASVGMFLSILLAVLNLGPHMMGSEYVTRSEWLHIAAPLVAVIGILMAFISYGLASRRTWSRHVVIAMLSLIIVYASILGALNLIHRAIMWRAIIDATIFGGLSPGIFISNQMWRRISASWQVRIQRLLGLSPARCLLLGSTGCQPVVRGSFPRTV
jgi:hypothetical protein